MTRIKYYLLLWLLLSGFIARAQNTNSSYIGLEGGVISYFNSIKEKDYNRKLSSSNSDDTPSNDFPNFLTVSYVGIKYEQLFLEDRIGVTAGVRFTKANSRIGIHGFFDPDENYFYLRVREEGTTTEYLRVRKVRQKSSYVGIPIEVRYLFFNSSFTRLYFKVGSAFDFLTKSKNELDLHSYTTPELEKLAVNKLGTPVDFSSTLYGSIGMRLGRSFPIFNVELTLPAVILNSNYSSLLSPAAGMGIQCTLQIPTKSKKQ